ncbi:hypothetical protein GOP47_0014845 [Adiantum capillus-veneris]|uniref:Uncharacterized protein n=1 Tax=Adiantum capillus-veneris TaxID=13818 RepID=A0A9D4UMT5_ADICA|nr:hypothetical protein GOP47_0014845 [Adiantum capillus-veneris]
MPYTVPIETRTTKVPTGRQGYRSYYSATRVLTIELEVEQGPIDSFIVETIKYEIIRIQNVRRKRRESGWLPFELRVACPGRLCHGEFPRSWSKLVLNYALVPTTIASLHFSGEMCSKRKTPSELRSEQLKRLQNDQNQASCSSESNQFLQALQKQDVLRPPRFVDTRVPDIYPVTKLGDRSSRFLAEKKEMPHVTLRCSEHVNPDAGVSTVADRARSLAKFHWKGAEESNDTNLGAKASTVETNPQNLHKSSSFSTFRDVTQLSTRLQENSSGPPVDMAKAFKGMSAARAATVTELTAGPPLAAKAPQLHSTSKSKAQDKPSSLFIHGNKLPLDLSLKTSIRFTSRASFERFERITNKDLCTGMKRFLSASQGQGEHDAQNDARPGDFLGNKVEAAFAEALHSWIHPQCVLPSSVLSALASSAAHGGTSERDFLSKRQLAWEDSFRSLYYMFRDGECDLFYFSTQQFIAMFIGGEILKRTKKESSAYISRSTRGLRALLQEQDIAFTMPLCLTKVATSIEEIQELTEFEKSHPGQTRLVDSMIAVDNSPQSLLVFNGQKSVHGLYDLLLNHRSMLSSTTGADVPVLYSPVTFQNASLVMSEVLCKKTQSPVESNVISNEQSKGLLMNTNYSLEVKGGILPPWVIWRVCTAIQQLQPGNFEASLITDPLSGGFNVGQDYTVEGLEQETETTSVLKKELNALLLSSEMKVGFVRQFKREEGSYAVTLSTV